MLTNPANSYFQNRIETATPEQLTLLLLEGACRYALLAQNCLEANSIKESNAHLQRCQLIIEELMVTLDFSAGAVADNLFAIYDYLHYLLVQANIRKDPQLMPEVVKYLNDLRESWSQVTRALDKGDGNA